MTRTTNNGSTTAHVRSALITDHLGTANTTVELTGNQPVTRRAAKPYGEARGPQPTTWPNKRGYLGVGIDDKVTGLTHIGAREYDQSTGRFLSADPVIDFADPLQMNGYAYANNSPVSSSDPSGLWTEGGAGKREPHPRETGKPRSNVGVPRGGTGAGGCYHTCDDPPTISEVGIIGVTRDAAREGRKHIYAAVSTLSSSARQRDAWLKTYRDRLEPEYAKGEVIDVKQMIKVAVNVCFDDNVSCPQRLRNYFQALDGGVDSTFGLYEGIFGGASPGRVAAKTDLGRALTAYCKCFLAGTDVLMADGTTKDIEDIDVGDKVRATDPETGESGSRTVTRLIRTEDDKHFNELSIATEDGVQKLSATFEHPFWSPSEDAWLEARQLKPGMTLLTDDGDTVIVTANREYTRHARTCNLTVEDLHSYYVLAGKTPVLVHNSARCPTAINLGPRPAGVGDDWVGRGADNGKGTVWQKPGSTGNGDMVRVMDPTGRYPDDYIRFHNKSGQPIGLNGKPGSKADTHIPMNPDGTYPLPVGW